MPMVDIEWLQEHVAVPADLTYEQLAQDLVRVGFEEESIHNNNVIGPLVVGYVVDCVEEPQKNGKIIHFCHVDVGEHNPIDKDGNKRYRTIICGAPNIATGEKVVVALPGAVLPGDFRIEPRKTYGHMSEGMCASERELGLSDEHNGIILLKNLGLSEEEYDKLRPGTDVLGLLHLNEDCLEINITPDRGYAFSYRGIAREYHHSTQQPFVDPVDKLLEKYQNQYYTNDNDVNVIIDDEHPINNRVGCDRFHATVIQIEENTSTPHWLRRRLSRAGMRSVNPVVDITNYVMLDLGQPMHAYDYDLVSMPIVVRRAKNDEILVTLDGKKHELSEEDLLITDSPNGERGSRILGIAGVMGGLYGEVTEKTRRVLLESAHFDPVTVARSARRHKTPSDASKRFERGVDPQLPPAASQLACDLLKDINHGSITSKPLDINNVVERLPFNFNCSEVHRVTGLSTPSQKIISILQDIGCTVQSSDTLRVDDNFDNKNNGSIRVTPPSWRPDLAESCDLVEEVARLIGYDNIPIRVPQARADKQLGLTLAQRTKRRIADELAQSGLVETLTYPFVGQADLQPLRYDSAQIEKKYVTVANPLAGDKPFLRTDILSTLVSCIQRNLRRGLTDISLYELGHVYIQREKTSVIPSLPGSCKPSDEQLEQLDKGLPYQPLHVSALMTGKRRETDWLHEERDVDWTYAIQVVNRLADRLGLVVSYDQQAFAQYKTDDDIAKQCAQHLIINTAQWHPGRTALITVKNASNTYIIGIVGELHPRVLEQLHLPEHSSAFELDCDMLVQLLETSPVQITPVSTFPPVYQDLAFIVPKTMSAEYLQTIIVEASQPYLEDITLFDVFTSDEQLGKDYKSLAFSLTLRSRDKTLTTQDIDVIRQSIIQAAEQQDAKLRA